MNLKYKLHILFLFGYVLSSQLLKSQEIKVEAKLDSIAIEIGDQVWLNLKVTQPKDDKIIFPAIKDTIIKGIDVLETTGIDTQQTGNQILTTQKLLITAFDDSIYSIPPFAFRHGNDTLFSNPLILSVKGVDLDSAEIAKIDTAQMLKVFDVKPPINTPFTFKEFFQRYYKLILIILGVLIIVALVVFYFIRRAANKPFIKLPEKPKEPAHVIALRALDELKAKKLWQADNQKLYYSELTEILRQYIEDRFHIPTFERTSYELLESLGAQKLLSQELFNELKQTLSLADLAKFAKYKPLPDENDLSLKNSYKLVETTKLIEKVHVADADENIEIKDINNQENKKF